MKISNIFEKGITTKAGMSTGYKVIGNIYENRELLYEFSRTD